MNSPLSPGAPFGPFRLVAPLGRGGMATVWKAHEAALDRFVALKVLPAEFLHEESFAARFRREARLSALLEHPGIVPIFAFGIEGGVPWMSSRLIPGGSLAALLEQGPLPRERVVAIVRRVADALTYAHGMGVAHRDVKPQNILLDDVGGVYLADFGIARMLESEESITRTGLVSGTPQYMAPEYGAGAALDHRVDVYSLGVVAYEMLTGAAPFNADTPVAVLLKHVSAPVPIPASDVVPEPLLGPLLRCLAKSPEDRWSTATEFADALERGLAAAPAAPRPQPGRLETAATEIVPAAAHTHTVAVAVAAAPPKRGRPTLYAVLGAALALAIIAFGVFVLRRGALGPPAGDAPSAQPGSLIAPSAPSAPIAGSSPPTAPKPLVVSPRPAPPTQKAPPLSAPQPTSVPDPNEPSAPATAKRIAVEGYAFGLDAQIALTGVGNGPVQLEAITFRRLRDSLEARILTSCANGKDQVVNYSIVLLDAAGEPVATLQGRADVDEGDRTTLRRKQRLSDGQLAAIRFVRVAVSSTPD